MVGEARGNRVVELERRMGRVTEPSGLAMCAFGASGVASNVVTSVSLQWGSTQFSFLRIVYHQKAVHRFCFLSCVQKLPFG